MGKRGETAAPADAAKGLVWSSIIQGWQTVGFDNEFVTVADLQWETLAKHPWSLGGGGAAGLKIDLERAASAILNEFVHNVGFASFAGLDEPFYQPHGVFCRLGYTKDLVRPLLTGQSIRDWSLVSEKEALTPYSAEDSSPMAFAGNLETPVHLWRYRTSLKGVKSFAGDRESEGAQWWCWYRWIPERYRVQLRLTYAAVATHNHFGIERGRYVFNNKAPIILLKDSAGESEHLALLGLLNSSTLAFWMRQVFQVKGGQSTGTKRQSEAWSRRLEYDGTKLRKAPIVERHRTRVVEIATNLDRLATEAGQCSPQAVIGGNWEANDLSQKIDGARSRLEVIRREMVAWQEELDWTVYAAFGLVDDGIGLVGGSPEPIASEHRPFAIHLARRLVAGEVSTHWFTALNLAPSTDVPDTYSQRTRETILRRTAVLERSDTLALIEVPECKRKWEWPSFDDALASASFDWFSNAIERVIERKGKPLPPAHIVAALQDNERFLALASRYQDRRDTDVAGLVEGILVAESVAAHPLHTYTDAGLAKRAAWEDVWIAQRKEDLGEKVLTAMVPPPEYSQGSRGKSTDFLRNEYWQLRGKLDVPKERFIAFTEVPGRSGSETLYGWAGWTPVQRLRAILAIDENLEDADVPLTDRIGLLDSAWRLLSDVAREDSAAAARLKAELQALVGPKGPSPELIEDWRKRFSPSSARPSKAKRAAKAREKDLENEENDES
jgi:hypothetical protein